MNQTISTFAQHIGLPLSAGQVELLERYAGLVWQKKDFLNLTSAADVQEIYARHICDGLTAAAFIYKESQGANGVEVGDAGAGAGYIGLVCAVALPQSRITLIESLQRRSSFMNWAILTLGLKNARVVNCRLGEKTAFSLDYLTERAMGKLTDILPLCAAAVKAGGKFIAFQGEHPDEMTPALLAKCGVRARALQPYALPQDDKKRFLAVFDKD